MYENAGVAELADARDLKSRELIPRAGSIPVSGTKATKLISRGRAARLARRAHNPEVRRFKSPPRNQKEQTPNRESVLFRYEVDFSASYPPKLESERRKARRYLFRQRRNPANSDLCGLILINVCRSNKTINPNGR